MCHSPMAAQPRWALCRSLAPLQPCRSLANSVQHTVPVQGGAAPAPRHEPCTRPGSCPVPAWPRVQAADAGVHVHWSMLSAHPQGCAHGLRAVVCAGGNYDRGYPAPHLCPPLPGLPSPVMSPRGAWGVQQPLCPHSNQEDAPGDVASRSPWGTADQWPGSSGTRASPHSALCPLSPAASKNHKPDTDQGLWKQPRVSHKIQASSISSPQHLPGQQPWPHHAALVPPCCPRSWGSPAQTGPCPRTPGWQPCGGSRASMPILPVLQSPWPRCPGSPCTAPPQHFTSDIYLRTQD